MNEQELLATLEKFGLSPQEGNLFVLLSRIRRSGSEWVSASDLAKAASKDRVRVYQILHRLQQVGLAESRYGRPKKYAAVRPPTAIRRLMALIETRLNELSYLENEVVNSLLNVSPTIIKGSNEDEVDLKKSGTVLVQGLPNIQATLRKIMEGEEIQLIANVESYSHLTRVMKYLVTKPKSTRIILASSGTPRIILPRSDARHTLKIQPFPADLPTIIITSKYCALPFYSLEQHKLKALSKPVSRAQVSDLVMTNDPSYVRRMRQLFRVLEAKTESRSGM